MHRRSLMAGLLATPVAIKASVTLAQAGPDDPLCYASVDDLMAMFRQRLSQPAAGTA